MFGFIIKYFFSCNALKFVSMNNQEYKVRPEVLDSNSNEPSFYPYSILVKKWSVSCNNINDPYTKLCVPDAVKGMNIKLFNLMSKINETRRLSWHETCTCKSRLNPSVCYNKQCGIMINADVNAKNWLAR